MSQVRVPPVYDGSGAQVAATVDVWLVTADGVTVLAFNATDLATEYQGVPIPDDPFDGLLLDLAPTAALALPSGAATWYRITVNTAHRAETYTIQVPDDPTVQELATLVAAAAIDPDDITAGLILTPDERAAMDAANAPDANNAFATIADVESGVAGVASFEGRTGAVTATAGDYQASEIAVDAAGFNGNLAVTDVTVQMVAQKLDDLVVGGGDGDVVDGGILATGLTFPVDGLHICDTNASHDLIVSPGSDLTADRTLTLTTGDASRTLTLTADASVAGTNTGDQDLSGYALTSSLGDAALLDVGMVAGTVAAGDDARFSAIGAIGSGVDFFPTDTAIVAAGTNSTYPIKTLAKAPSGLAEDVDAITIPGSSTAMYGSYLYDTALSGDQLDGGIWEFHVYGGVDSATGVTTLTQNVYRVRPEAVVTATTTGTGTSRTCTASGGTPFATGVIDASASLLDCSFVQTPQGLYPITARTSDTEVTITTPTTYVNESGVTLSVHKKLFGVTSGELNNVAGTAPAWTGIILLPEMLSVQADIPLVAGDRIATTFLGTTTSATTRTLYFAHDGTTRYSHFHTPLELQHNDLEGLQGGTTGQMYHLTAAQAGALHDAVTVADSTTVDLTLTGQQISAAAIVQMSITADASGIKLSGDAATPGATKLYGTNSSGTKGWYDQPAGGTGHDAVTLAGTPDYITLTDQVITRNQIDLSADVTGTLPVANGGTGRTAGVAEDVQTFTSSGTWTKPTGGQTRCEIFVVGAGGGGGTGRVGASATNTNGGTGGAGGAAIRIGYDLSAFGSEVTVTIGAGGAGGAAVTTDGTNGNVGSAGGDTSFGSIVAPGGAGGFGGTNASTGVIGPLGSVGYPAISGAGSTANVAISTGITAPASPLGGGGGGGGGGLSGSNILRVGSAGAAGSPGYLASLIAGGAIGTSGGFAGGAGDPASDASAVEANATGAGGGGGHAVATADSGAGGAGGYPGGGGGGAGAARDGYDTGAGGDGANGYVRVRCW